MKTVYLAGGINGLSDSECKDWREEVKTRLAGKFHFLDPMRRDYRGTEDKDYHEIVKGDISDIRNSDYVLAMCSQPSWGTAMEIRAAAVEYAKPVISVATGKISPWLRAHSVDLCPTLEKAIEVLTDLWRYDNVISFIRNNS